MRLNQSLRYIFYSGLLALAFACNPEKNDPGANFDRKGMLQNLATNIIVPNYQALNTKTAALDQAATQFVASPDAAKLSALQQAWKEAALAWQRTEMFEFGPAEKVLLRSKLSSFPTQPQKMEDKIASATSFPQTDIDATDAFIKGFPAVEYLVFTLNGNNAEVLSRYTTDAKAANRKAYLQALARDINAKVAGVANEWSATGGNYTAAFVNSTGTAIGSSIGLLVNQMSYELDWMSTQKIGIALGKRSLGQIFPEQVEGYYSKMSVPFIQENQRTLEALFTGKQGLGIDDYLSALEVKHEGAPLNNSVLARIKTSDEFLALIKPSLSEAIAANDPNVSKAFDALKKQLIHFKVDVPSALGVTITYTDNDGD